MAVSLLILASLACNIFQPAPTPTPTGAPAQTATPVVSPTPQPPIAPRVIDYTPVRGDELPPDGGITVYFDNAMDQASVESAFKVDPAVAGAFAWPDPATVQFLPNQPLERAARYTVTIAATARSTAGLALVEPLSFNADTVGFLEVTQVLPAPDTAAVEVGAVVTLMFNRPVVPLTALENQAGLPHPLTLDPAVPGSGEWINTSIYVFRPEVPLAGGQTYTGRVAAGLGDTTGGMLADDYTWQFTVQVPEVIASEPFFSQTDVRLTQPISVTFNQPMDRASVEAVFHLQGPDGADRPGTFRWSADGLTRRLLPRRQPAARDRPASDHRRLGRLGRRRRDPARALHRLLHHRARARPALHRAVQPRPGRRLPQRLPPVLQLAHGCRHHRAERRDRAQAHPGLHLLERVQLQFLLRLEPGPLH